MLSWLLYNIFGVLSLIAPFALCLWAILRSGKSVEFAVFWLRFLGYACVIGCLITIIVHVVARNYFQYDVEWHVYTALLVPLAYLGFYVLCGIVISCVLHLAIHRRLQVSAHCADESVRPHLSKYFRIFGVAHRFMSLFTGLSYTQLLSAIATTNERVKTNTDPASTDRK